MGSLTKCLEIHKDKFSDGERAAILKAAAGYESAYVGKPNPKQLAALAAVEDILYDLDAEKSAIVKQVEKQSPTAAAAKAKLEEAEKEKARVVEAEKEKVKTEAAAKETAKLTEVAKEKAFFELADSQRGTPEQAMLKVTRLIGGGVYGYVAEHVGDLTHRMSENFKFLKGGKENVLD